MIIRARPQFISEDDLIKGGETEIDNHLSEEELFFNLGRSALKFFLINYSSFKKKTVKVAMQSFNCQVVYQAAEEANCPIELFDNNLNDFSASLDEIKRLKHLPDVLILTHYQGIPNISYTEIADYCVKNNIFLLDDMSHAEGSKINTIPLGKISGASLHSFAFDKPFSCFKGGSLNIKNIEDKEFKQNLLQAYSKLKKETSATALRHIKILSFLIKNSAPSSYSTAINNYDLIEFLFTLRIPEVLVSAIIKRDFCLTLWNWRTRILIKTGIWKINKDLGYVIPEIKVLKMHEKKVQLILCQVKKHHATYDSSEVKFLEEFLKKNNIKINTYPGSYIRWNRYSILDETNKIAKILDKKEIEFGNYNWPTPLHLMHKHHMKERKFLNAEIASEKIVNIPVWSDYFKNKMPLNDK